MKFKDFLLEGKGKSVSIVRIGGLSKVKYKGGTFGDFHKPPVKKGYFAFLANYIEPFLYKWKYNAFDKLAKKQNIDFDALSDEEREKFEREAEKKNKELEHNDRHRKIEYRGWLWCHFVNEALEYYKGSVEIKGSWAKVHSDDFEQIFKKMMKNDTKALMKDKLSFNGTNRNPIKDPYKRGKSGGMTISRDHLEVFIP